MLKRVSIQNFKSLKDVTLDLQPVNLLIGPNNSGKTNLLKALEFFQEFARENVRVDNHIRFGRSSWPVSIKLLYEDRLAYDSAERFYEYNLDLLKSEPRFLDEQTYKIFMSTGSELEVMKTIENTGLSFANYKMNQQIGRISVNQPNPVLLTKPFPLIPNSESINSDASNIVAFLDTIRDKNPESFYAIQNDLKKCVAEFSQIRFDNIEPNELQKLQHGDKTFKILGLYHDILKTTFWADEVSEGVLYFLALLCIINQPNPPKLLLLEEPERGIHPRRIHEVMDFMFRLAEEKDIQIIMTSHNENVLNEFRSMPEAVFVFDKDDEGATQVKNLQRDIIEPSHQRSRESKTELIDFTGELGANWMYGLLGGVPKDDV